MRTIKRITEAMIKSLTEEPQSSLSVLNANNDWELYSLPVRIAKRILVDDVTGCWRTSGWNTGNGFANMSVLGQTMKVHRVTYTLLRGPIPDGHVVDHDKRTGCKYRDCCNPWHGEPVTVKENTYRGEAPLFPKRSLLGGAA